MRKNVDAGRSRVSARRRMWAGWQVRSSCIESLEERALLSTTIGPGNVSGVWTAADGPYTVTGAVTVPAGQTLTIEPGVTVFFQSAAGIQVKGTLLAEG